MLTIHALLICVNYFVQSQQRLFHTQTVQNLAKSSLFISHAGLFRSAPDTSYPGVWFTAVLHAIERVLLDEHLAKKRVILTSDVRHCSCATLSDHSSDMALAARQWLCTCLLALLVAGATAESLRALRGIDVGPSPAPQPAGGLLGRVAAATAGQGQGLLGKVKARVDQVRLCKVDCISGEAKYLYDATCLGKCAP